MAQAIEARQHIIPIKDVTDKHPGWIQTSTIPVTQTGSKIGTIDFIRLNFLMDPKNQNGFGIPAGGTKLDQVEGRLRTQMIRELKNAEKDLKEENPAPGSILTFQQISQYFRHL